MYIKLGNNLNAAVILYLWQYENVLLTSRRCIIIERKNERE
jgi:hypothetical protein